MAAKRSTTAKKKGPARRDAGRPRGPPITAVVLEATLAELAAQGLAGLSVDRIARAAGVNKTSIYRRYPSRDALVVAALERVHDGLGARIVDSGSLRGDLRSLVRAVAAFLGQPLGRALLGAMASAPVAADVAAAARARLAASATQTVQAVILRALARGEWRAGVDPVVVLSLLVGGLLHRVLLEQAPLDEPFVDGLVDVVVAGIAPR
jgi:AcrR family transcriptional regulator